MATDIYVINDTYSEVTRERDPNDEWDADNTATSNCIRGFKIVNKSSKKNEYTDLTIDFEVKETIPYYLLSVIYSTGDSFSHHTGHIEYIDLYSNIEYAEAAQKMIENAYAAKDKEERYSVDILDNNGNMRKISSSSWVGYFESLEEVRIDTVIKQN